MSLIIDEAFLARTLVDLVQIDSRNPSLVPGAPGEATIAAYIAGALTRLGLDVTTHAFAPGRVNVVGVLRGAGGGPCLMLNGHMDTVGVEGMADPFSGAVRDGRVYGRGSQDMKGGLAAMIAAAKALVDAGVPLAGDLIVAAVADEEYYSAGTEDLIKHHRADAAIVAEPTNLALVRAHRGFIWYQMETIGRAAHGSRYNEGIDANMRMGRFLAELDKLERAVRQRPPHPLAGPPSLHAGLIQGGTGISTYAARCELQIEWRSAPGETEPQVTGELQGIINRLAAADPTFKASLRVNCQRPPLETDAGAEIVRAVEDAALRRLGRVPAHAGASFWSDAALLATAGTQAILMGPVGDGLHSAEEWVDLASVRDLAIVLAETAAAFCG